MRHAEYDRCFCPEKARPYPSSQPIFIGSVFINKNGIIAKQIAIALLGSTADYPYQTSEFYVNSR